MIVNGTNLAAAAKGFRALFKGKLGSVETLYQKLAMVVPSSSPEEAYAWLGDLPRMREWVGDRVVQNLKEHGFAIRKKDWESTISVSRDEIQFDKLGMVRPRIEMLASEAGSHYDELLFFVLMPDGFTVACFDGQYFFDTDHPVAGESVSNKGTAALAPASYASARAGMMSLTGDAGKPLGIVPTHLVVGPALEATGKEILVAERTSAGATNPHKGTAELLVTPWLAGHPTKWFLLDLSKPVKPFIVQIVTKPELVALDQPTDENAFMRKQFLYGVDAQHNAGYALWQLAFGSTGAA